MEVASVEFILWKPEHDLFIISGMRYHIYIWQRDVFGKESGEQEKS